MNNLPSCKISSAVLLLKLHLFWWFTNRTTVSKHRSLKRETILWLSAIQYRKCTNTLIFMFIVYIAIKLFCKCNKTIKKKEKETF